jgi:hypothetical protein
LRSIEIMDPEISLQATMFGKVAGRNFADAIPRCFNPKSLNDISHSIECVCSWLLQ